ncbi:MAG: hypothetical protein ISS16_10950 [Ignavibacteria bacterium]|nr:hypothetical protein [Ignavibacteria bacterium]
MKRIYKYTGSNTGEGYYGLNRVTYIGEAFKPRCWCSHQQQNIFNFMVVGDNTNNWLNKENVTRKIILSTQ